MSNYFLKAAFMAAVVFQTIPSAEAILTDGKSKSRQYENWGKIDEFRAVGCLRSYKPKEKAYGLSTATLISDKEALGAAHAANSLIAEQDKAELERFLKSDKHAIVLPCKNTQLHFGASLEDAEQVVDVKSVRLLKPYVRACLNNAAHDTEKVAWDAAVFQLATSPKGIKPIPPLKIMVGKINSATVVGFGAGWDSQVKKRAARFGVAEDFSQNVLQFITPDRDKDYDNYEYAFAQHQLKQPGPPPGFIQEGDSGAPCLVSIQDGFRIVAICSGGAPKNLSRVWSESKKANEVLAKALQKPMMKKNPQELFEESWTAMMTPLVYRFPKNNAVVDNNILSAD